MHDRYDIHADIRVLFDRHLAQAPMPWTPHVLAAFMHDMLPVSRVAEVRVNADDQENFLAVTLTDGTAIEYGYRIIDA